MATSIASQLSSIELELERYRRERSFAAVLVTALTFLALLIHGYHPYAEDGGIYLPEIKRLLDPALYPYGAEFVVGHLRYSVFAPLVAGLVRESRLSLEMVLLLVHLASFWMTLFAAWLLAARCYASREARCGAVALLAVWLTIPIAGTSLMLMDPYVTARSISTPCALLALVGALQFLSPQFEMKGEWQRGLGLCCGALMGAATMHPLMGAYALGSVLVLGTTLWTSRLVRVWGTVGLCLTAVIVAAGVQLSSPVESADYQRVMLTRYYWFLSQWHWYEWVGLAAPLMILAIVAVRRGRDLEVVGVALARVAIASGGTAIVVALLFAREGAAVHQVARLQPLRVFQLVYVVMILIMGSTLGERLLRRRAWRWVAAFSVLATIMLQVDRIAFPASKYLELPAALGWTGGGGGNRWMQAFVWIRENTPKNAVFALDAHYTVQEGEDAQGFRAIAERSSLPDSKDGGTASNRPELTEEWSQGMALQTGLGGGLGRESAPGRLAGLKAVGATWVILERDAAAGFGCAYENEVVKVCRLP
ncbi:DUF6798 domain-containing protein [Tunturibacter empetritectus]|uniref:Uncharacterized protein n=1 Tax=Tunturiibacter lichenicola TaxID=2051959 RepID=A0A7W8JB26_9BACT|nr:DUF6798 domain-containing protein [Edaphobacter lichenicola]MBB5346005.1 hypothetical protein [Edaphobacter lichenicola]